MYNCTCIRSVIHVLVYVKYIVYSPSSLSIVVSAVLDMCRGKRMNGNEKGKREKENENSIQTRPFLS